MARFTVTEAFEGREGDILADSGRSYTRVFWVGSDDPTVTADEVCRAPGVPTLGEPYITLRGARDLGAFVREVRAAQRESPREWRVEVRYETRQKDARDGKLGAGGDATIPPAGGGGDGNGGGGGGNGDHGGGGGGGGPAEAQITNPLLRPPEITWGTNRVMVVLQKDQLGDAITNSAGLKYDPPVEVEEVRLRLRVVRNEAAFDANTIKDYVNAVNTSAWYGFGANALRVMDIGASRKEENGVYFWVVHYEFEHRTPDWQLRLLDAGYYEKVAGKPRLIVDDRLAMAATTPFLLDGNGRKLALGGTPVERLFNVYPPKDFRGLGLGG